MNIIRKLPAFTLILIFSGLNSAVYAIEKRCSLNLPNPVLVPNGTVDYEENGKQWTRYNLKVSNRKSYPYFPLKLCGYKDNSSPSWLHIYETGKKISGFCALSFGKDKIWFAKERRAPPPTSIYVQTYDPICQEYYTSNRVKFDNPVVDVDCEEGLSMKDAIATVNPKGTINVGGGTCNETEPLVIPKAKEGITLAGSVDGRTVIDGGGRDIPLLTIKGTKNVTITNLTFRNSGKEGIVYTDQASGKLFNVAAQDNNEGIVIDKRSVVKFHGVNASNNDSVGIRISNGSRARFMELAQTENQCREPDEQLPDLLIAKSIVKIPPVPLVRSLSLVRSLPIVKSIHPCYVVASNNGRKLGSDGDRDDTKNLVSGILVDGAFTTAGSENNADSEIIEATSLEIDNCSVKLSGNQDAGLAIIGGATVTTEGATLIIEKNSDAGIIMSDASTLVLDSFPPDIQSKVESNFNLYGMDVDGSSITLKDRSEIGVRNNHESGAYFYFIQSLTCDSGAQFILSNNEPNVETDGIIPGNGERCITIN